MAKAPDAFRTISEAATELGLPAHVLRHWEETFGAIRPMRRAGGRRYYRLQDLKLLSGVQALLHGERYTTKGVQKIFKDHGSGFVAEIGRQVMEGMAPEEAVSAALKQEEASNAGPSISTDHLCALRDQLRQLKNDVRTLREQG